MRLLFLFFNFFALSVYGGNLKVLHLTFHQGLANEFEGVAKELSLELTTWNLNQLPANFFDPLSEKSHLYNIGVERAARIWDKHKYFFNQFDVVVTSDTAPLARIFLQNNFHKHLVIWVCNRFDYCDRDSLDCDFPDKEFYALFNEAAKSPRVTIISYTPFEKIYAKSKGVDLGNLIIKPCSPSIKPLEKSKIPKEIDKAQTIYVIPRYNETTYADVPQILEQRGIKNYRGAYNGPSDLADFKGIVHLPYAWSNLALFENLRLGIPCFVPSEKFLKKLRSNPKSEYWFQDRKFLSKFLHECEWYNPELKNVLVYFDSWEDLSNKIKKTDYAKIKVRSIAYGEKHKTTMLGSWKKVFEKIKI